MKDRGAETRRWRNAFYDLPVSYSPMAMLNGKPAQKLRVTDKILKEAAKRAKEARK